MSRTRFLAPLVVVSLLGVGCGSDDGSGGDSPAAADNRIELQYAHYNGPKAAQSVSTAGWADAIEEKTDGQVAIKFFYQGSLLGPTDMLEGVASGRADLGYVANSYFPSELPLSKIAEIPFVTSDTVAQAQTFHDLYESNADFQAEYEKQGVKLLNFQLISGTILGSKDPVPDPDSVRGKKIRVAGGIADALQVLGASPVNLGAPEIYESLQRGLIDGYSSFPFGVMSDLQLQEVAPYVAEPGLGQFAIPATVINLKTWESLPEAAKTAITEESDAFIDRAAKDLVSVEDSACDALLEAGGTVTLWSEADVASWKEKIRSSAEEQWLEQAAASVGEEAAEAFRAEYFEKLASYEQTSSYESGVRRCASRAE